MVRRKLVKGLNTVNVNGKMGCSDMTAKVLISDKLSGKGLELLQKHFQVDMKTGLSEDQLCEIIGDYDAMLVRSETKVTAKIIEKANKMKIIGRAGVGVDNIDVPAATKKGIIVVNSPEGNTIAAAEHSFALLMSMTRNIPAAHNSAQKGEWKRTQFTGIELFGKTLGVVGLGKIGKRVARYGAGFGMNVIGYDPMLNEAVAEQLGIKLLKLEEVLRSADYISFHIPKNKETLHLIDKSKFAMMKDGVFIVNCARGGIIVEADLKEAVESGKVKAAAVDVFEEEPIKPDNVLLGVKNIITTPHIGASTEEAQENVAIDVAEQVCDVLQGRQAKAAVNIPSLKPELLDPVKKFMSLAEKLGLIVSQIVGADAATIIEITYQGDLAGKEIHALNLAVVKGFLYPIVQEAVNFVNAEIIAAERGLNIKATQSTGPSDYKNAITVKVETKESEVEVTGSSFEDIGDVVVSINGFKVNLIPEGLILFVPNNDKPGIIGKIGSLLGENKINIASMQVGREAKGGNAVMLVTVDQSVPDALIAGIEKLSEIRGKVKQIQIR